MSARVLLAALAALTLPAAAAQAGPTLFVANKRANTLTKIDLETGETLAEVATCATPHELALSPGGGLLAVACYGGGEVAIHKPDTLEQDHTTWLGEGARPHGIVWPTRVSFYVTAEGRKSIFVGRDPRAHGVPTPRRIEVGQDGTHMIVVNRALSRAWTTDMGSGTVSLINLYMGEKVASVPVGREPEGIALTPDGGTLWVSARGSDQAFALDPETLEIRAVVATGRFPLRIAVRPQGDVAITSNLQDGSLSVIDLATNTVTRTIAVSAPGEAEARFQVTILWSPDGSRIYVAETGTSTVAEVDYASGTVLRRFKAGDGGDGLAILP